MKRKLLFNYFCTIVLVLITSQLFQAQISINEIEGNHSLSLKRENGINMLSDIKEIVKKYYYDRKFRGINIDERFKTAKEKIKTLETNAQIFRTIAQVLLDFNDSHTKFYPPNRSIRFEYGFSMQMIGQKCYVVDVKKGSDAETKGLKPGDQITNLEGLVPDRELLWIIKYIIYRLEPREMIRLKYLDVDNKEKSLEIKARLKTLKEREKEREQGDKKKKAEKEDTNSYRCKELNSELIACKLKSFIAEKKEIENMMKEVSLHKKLILDLRGNSGGYVKIEEYLTGFFFDRTIKIADFITREKSEERIAKSHKGKVFGGELIVLIDSDSASASEVFSRVIQIEKRGKIIGDISAGAVMTSYGIPMTNSRGVPGYETLSFYSISVTVADLVMSDGKRLESVGVIPDLLIGPTNVAMLNRHDPVLAYAAQLFGTELSQENAGKFYFLNQKPEEEKEEITSDERKK